MSWEEAARTKREAVLSLIPQEWRIPAPPPASEQRDITGAYIEQYLSPSEVEITNTDAVTINENARSGHWTAVDITRAFCHRAAIAHQLANCLHEIFFDDALAAAKGLDEYKAQHGKVKGLLHGLPVSLKDQVHVRGVETSMGYVGWLGTFQGEKGTGKERVFESEIARELRELGAVLYCKTAVPHTLMCGETVNNIVGYVNNPKNRNLSAGGSSGGEGALIALGASPIGMGTDIGGSIRIPAAFNGLYGIRPSAGRFPYEGMANSFDGGPGIISVVGPLAPNAGALRLVTRAILSQEPWLHDPLVHELPYRDEIEHETISLANSGKLCFAVLRHDGVCVPHPPVARAIEKTVEALTKAGHKVVEWKPPVSHQLLGDLSMKCFAFDGGRDAAKAFALSDEPMAPHVLGPYKEPIDELGATEIMQTMVLKRNLCKDYMDYWNSTVALTGTGRPVDAFITALAPFSAPRPTKYTYYGYSTFVNLLDYTAVVLPVLQADKAIDKRAEGFKAMSDLDQVTQDSYDPEVYDGAAVSVQLVGRRLQEEKMLALAEYVGQLV